MLLSVVTCALLALLAARSAAESGVGLRCQHERCQYLGYNRYLVDGNQIWIEYEFATLKIYCERTSVLESLALPRPVQAVRVSHVMLQQCPLPASRSLADTLASVNVTLQCHESDVPGTPCGNLSLIELPTMPQLVAMHFDGLEHITHMRILGYLNDRPRPKLGYLAPLQNLRSLSITNLVLPAGESNSSLPSLRKLYLCYVDYLEWFPKTPALESLEMFVWKKPHSETLAHCHSLYDLYLTIEPSDIVLPDDWLANCTLLEKLVMKMEHTKVTLPAKLFQGMRSLTHLRISGGSLGMLPAGLLDYSPNLLTIDLNNNDISTLPRSTFVVARKVHTLDLSGNKLDSQVMDALAPLEKLSMLKLANNPSLGDICKLDSYSVKSNAMKLSEQDMSHSSVRWVCAGWREHLARLTVLDLRGTNVSQLLFEDVQFTRNVEVQVYLPATVLTAVRNREDYNNVASSLWRGVTVHISGEVDCDCRTYWARRTLDLPPLADAQADELRCVDKQLLRDVPPEDMVCASPDECSTSGLPAECACAMRPDDNLSSDWRLVRVRCERAALTRVPYLRTRNHTTGQRYELLLAGNNISEIRADHLPHNIKGLDLRHNSLERVDEETATRLGAVDGMLRLAGNPLDCSCRNAPLLRALSARNETRIDLINSTCSDNSMLYTAFAMECMHSLSLITWLVIGLSVLLVFTIAVMACFMSRERLFFARAVLHRWGFKWRAAEPEDSDRCYDAFVTFSHKDHAVVQELMARLEPTYRLCIHDRDWVPGCYISEQIMQSVRDSRRTLALVSRHFLASSWARAEFHEAHTVTMLEARPRLIVVLLEEPTALDMDERLRRYVATQTYLRWGEHWFWDKLAVALPKPRVPPPPDTSPSDSTPSALESALLSASRVTRAPGTDAAESSSIMSTRL